MEPQAKAHRIRVWSRIPIKYKLALTIGMLMAALVVLLYSTQAQASYFMQATYAQENDYYNINSFQTSLLKADEALESYLRSPSDGMDYQDRWYSEYENMTQQISRLNLNASEVGPERYLLANAIKNGFVPYSERCEALFALWSSGATMPQMYAQYDSIDTVSGYLLQTTRQLQSRALSDGKSALADLRVKNQKQNQMYITLMVLASTVLVVIANELIRGIVVPVLRLSDASKAISEGNFDIPDVIVSSRDEIFTLAQAFNRMKHNMKHLFNAMQEKSEMEQRLHQKDLEASESRRLLEQAKMQQLRNQINPHFLFNTLNIISRTARREKAVSSEKLILALARLFRYSLKTDDTEVSLAREIHIVNDYVSIQSTRFENRVALRWRVSPRLEPEALLVPAFMLQPIVENAVIHGLEPKCSGGTIRIRAHMLGDVLHLIISDNGVGMDSDTLCALMEQQRVRGDVSGIGVGNVRSRLQMLNPGAAFHIYSRPGRGTCVHICLPNPQRTGQATFAALV